MKNVAGFCHFSKALYAGVAALALVTALTTGCSEARFEQKPPDANPTGICIPGDTGGNATNGLVGSLHYLDDSQPRYQTVMEIINNGHKVPQSLFLNQLNTPTVNFQRGFINQSGESLKRDDGNTLYYYFAFDVKSQIQLNGSNPTGNYQLAVISDDGVIVSLDQGSGYQTYIDGDGFNSSRFQCGTTPVNIQAASKIPVRVRYFQGPPTHIALVMMWRPWNGSAADPFCGKQGSDFGQDANNFFFDSTKIPSTPTSNYQALLNRGWRPLETSNFELPAGVTNPCSQQ